MLNEPVARDRVVEQPHQECNRSWNVDEGVKPVDVPHKRWVAHEELLNRHFPEYV